MGRPRRQLVQRGRVAGLKDFAEGLGVHVKEHVLEAFDKGNVDEAARVGGAFASVTAGLDEAVAAVEVAHTALLGALAGCGGSGGDLAVGRQFFFYGGSDGECGDEGDNVVVAEAAEGNDDEVFVDFEAEGVNDEVVEEFSGATLGGVALEGALPYPRVSSWLGPAGPQGSVVVAVEGPMGVPSRTQFGTHRQRCFDPCQCVSAKCVL